MYKRPARIEPMFLFGFLPDPTSLPARRRALFGYGAAAIVLIIFFFLGCFDLPLACFVRVLAVPSSWVVGRLSLRRQFWVIIRDTGISSTAR